MANGNQNKAVTAQTVQPVAGAKAPDTMPEGTVVGKFIVKGGIFVDKNTGSATPAPQAGPTVAPRPGDDSAGGAAARQAAGKVGSVVGGALGKIAGAAITAAGAGTSGTPEAVGSRQIANEKEKLAAQQGAQAQQHQQAANADIISRGDQWAGAKDAAMNQKRVANQAAASGAASALNREVSASDYGEQQEQANKRRQAGEIRTDQSAQNKVSAIGNRTDAAVSEREDKQIKEQNAAVDQVTQAEATPDVPPEEAQAEETPVTPSPNPPGDVATPEAPAEPAEENATEEEKVEAMDRVDNALEKKDGTMIAQPGEPLYQEGIDAFLEGDDAFKAWAQKVNAKATEMGLGADTFVPSNGLRNKATVGSKAGTFSGEGKSEPGEIGAEQAATAKKLSPDDPDSDRRIKDLKKIISDARMKTQKERTRKLVSSIYRRF
jgi:hypothetical protein